MNYSEYIITRARRQSLVFFLCKKYLLNFALVIEKRIQSSFMLQKLTGFFFTFRKFLLDF